MDRKRSGMAGRRHKEQGHACRAQAGNQCFMAGPTASMETGFTKGATKGTKLGPAPSEAGTLRKAPRKLSLSFRNAPSMGETPPELQQSVSSGKQEGGRHARAPQTPWQSSRLLMQFLDLEHAASGWQPWTLNTKRLCGG